MKKAIVIKIGGSTLGNHDTTLEDLVTLQKRGMSLVVIHGGAKIVSDWLARMQVPTSFIGGLRVTDEKSLEVVTAVLSGLVNKELVAAIEKRGGKAIGISGVDGGLVKASITKPELGLAGDVTAIDPVPLKMILSTGYIPVVSPVSLGDNLPANGATALLNVNADTVASEIAVALSAQKLIFLTDVAGIYNSKKELIPRLKAEEIREMVISGVASGGMAVKIEACLGALGTVEMICIIDGRVPHILLEEISGKKTGTIIME